MVFSTEEGEESDLTYMSSTEIGMLWLDELPQSGGLALGNGSTTDEITGRSNGFLTLENRR